MTGVAKNTVVKLLLEVAEVCREYQEGFSAISRASVCSSMKFGASFRWGFILGECPNSNAPSSSHSARRAAMRIKDFPLDSGFDDDRDFSFHAPRSRLIVDW